MDKRQEILNKIMATIAERLAVPDGDFDVFVMGGEAHTNTPTGKHVQHFDVSIQGA